MATSTEAAPARRRRVWLDILVYGLAGVVLTAVLKLTEYRFLVVEHSVEIYTSLVAALFAGVGIWLGLTLRRKKTVVIEKETPAPASFVLDENRRSELGITARETTLAAREPEGLDARMVRNPDAEARNGHTVTNE